jgi:hypothetical protein
VLPHVPARRRAGGFSVDASVRIEAEDRAGIERLVRYCARPPFALERLHALGSSTALASPESRLLYRFPKPDLHGRTEVLLTPLELLGASPSSFHPRECIVIATAGPSLQMPGCGLRSWALGRPEAPTAEGDSTAPAIAAEPAPERARSNTRVRPRRA